MADKTTSTAPLERVVDRRNQPTLFATGVSASIIPWQIHFCLQWWEDPAFHRIGEIGAATK
jgi:hypothetical protein